MPSGNKENNVRKILLDDFDKYLPSYNMDVSCDAYKGGGKSDLKVACGNDKTIIEIKLSTNSNYIKGFTEQIKAYGEAEQTDKLIYIFIDLGNPGRRKRIKELHDEFEREDKNPPELVIIDATRTWLPWCSRHT